MTAFDLVKEKVAYHQWANHQTIEWLRQHPVDLPEKKVVSSFPSINKLLHHMLEAEKYYFSILRQQEEVYEETMTTEAIYEELLEVDKVLLAWLLRQNAGIMDEIISLKRSPFVERYSVATLITHLVNHTTYHRGQLVALRHQLGMSTAPKVDYYRYFITP